MPLPKDQTYTIEDIYALPDGQRAELIDGQLYMMAPPNRKHQKLVGEFYRSISNYIHNNHGSCEVYPAPFAVFLNADDKTYVEPDISVICDRNKLDDRGCKGAPDWIIEIVSPSSRRMDYRSKHNLYGDAGVREYWIVDPEKERVTVYHYEEDDAPTIFLFTQPIPVGTFEGFQVTVADLLP